MADSRADDHPDLAGRERRRPDKTTLALGAVLTLLLVSVVVNVYLTLTRTTAACDFYHDLSGVPVATAKGALRPSELGISIVAHSRTAFRDSGCSGTLPPPSPSFARWAPYYHLPSE